MFYSVLVICAVLLFGMVINLAWGRPTPIIPSFFSENRAIDVYLGYSWMAVIISYCVVEFRAQLDRPR
jgi:hypothetical protein